VFLIEHWHQPYPVTAPSNHRRCVLISGVARALGLGKTSLSVAGGHVEAPNFKAKTDCRWKRDLTWDFPVGRDRRRSGDPTFFRSEQHVFALLAAPASSLRSPCQGYRMRLALVVAIPAWWSLLNARWGIPRARTWAIPTIGTPGLADINEAIQAHQSRSNKHSQPHASALRGLLARRNITGRKS
jgi:hypothetical protein